jgi:hypothetical protein
MRWSAIVLAMLFQHSLDAEPAWLAVVSTSPTVVQAINMAKRLRTSLGSVIIVATNDCENLKPGLFLSVTGISNNSDAAERRVAEARKTVHDAYVRNCEPKPGSRVQFTIDLVDASIYEVPADVVNWDDNDRISELRTAGLMHLWIRREYRKDENDPREGRRTSVWLFKNDPSAAQKITPDCADAEVVVSDSLIALTCARETAGDNLFHQVQVLDINIGRTVRTVDRCRTPKFVTASEFTCEAEAVGPDGGLKLTPQKFPLKVEVRTGTPGRTQPPK